jgi:hypothetical protein
VMHDRQRAGEVGEEDEACLQRADQEGLPAFVVRGDLGAELGDARRELLCRQIDLPDPLVGLSARAPRPEVRQEASFRPYR